MAETPSRRTFHSAAAGIVLASASDLVAAEEQGKKEPDKLQAGPVESAFQRDYTAPSFKPSWKKPQINRLMVQDFVIYAHSDLVMTKKLLEKEPALINSTMDWGGGDWESGLGGASHMGRRDIVTYLLAQGARIDLFCAAMLGLIDSVKSTLALEPKGAGTNKVVNFAYEV